ncbi:MAG TPA: hypothetical protein VFB63_21020 [Bryobacteraceae bacterium]|nr:hypothetical protein [Bryobacteraceae bacterium]
MEISRQDLEERFRALSDQVLVARVRAGTLTPLALKVALEELSTRGIEMAADTEATENHENQKDLEDFEDQEDHDHPTELDPDVDLVTVARFSNSWEANVLRACLESHGIFAFIWG